MIDRLNKSKGPVFKFEGNVDETRFSKAIEINIYRISQEAINNVLKHAKANEVLIQLFSRENMLTLMIEDDGIGFDHLSDRTSNHMGLLNMENRAVAIGGKLEINSKKEFGTQVLVELDLIGE